MPALTRETSVEIFGSSEAFNPFNGFFGLRLVINPLYQLEVAFDFCQ